MADWNESSAILLTCPRGLAPFLRAEVERLGFAVDGEGPGFVETTGTMLDTMKLNLWLRTAHRVLYRMATFRCNDPDTLYRQVQTIPWHEWISPDGYFTIQSSVDHPSVTDPRFPNLKTKDAVADRIRKECGRRPDTGPSRDGAAVFVHWHGENCAVYLNTSGEALQKRGYRKIPGPAPMQETLAAACVLASGWTGEGPFINPMCGSGTLAIEAALIAQGRAPASVRLHYSFTHLLGYPEDAFKELRQEARQQARRSLDVPIIATDIEPGAVDAARKNAGTAGVEQLIEFDVCDYTDTKVPEGGAGVVMFNPEYGVRLGEEAELIPVYRGLGDFFKQRCEGYRGYVFTGSIKLSKQIGLRPSKKWTLFNGPIECRFQEFDIYPNT